MMNIVKEVTFDRFGKVKKSRYIGVRDVGWGPWRRQVHEEVTITVTMSTACAELDRIVNTANLSCRSCREVADAFGRISFVMVKLSS